MTRLASTTTEIPPADSIRLVLGKTASDLADATRQARHRPLREVVPLNSFALDASSPKVVVHDVERRCMRADAALLRDRPVPLASALPGGSWHRTVHRPTHLWKFEAIRSRSASPTDRPLRHASTSCCATTVVTHAGSTSRTRVPRPQGQCHDSTRIYDAWGNGTQRETLVSCETSWGFPESRRHRGPSPRGPNLTEESSCPRRHKVAGVPARHGGWCGMKSTRAIEHERLSAPAADR